MKTKFFIRNMLTGVLGKIITIILALIIPKLVIENYGSEVNGIISSIMSLVVYLNLLEAGIGTVSIQALYSHIPQKNYSQVNRILSATSKFYFQNGMIYLVSLVVLALGYPFVVKSSLAFGQVEMIIFLLMAPNLVLFFVQGKYSVLLTADNKTYIASILTTITSVLINASKVILIVSGYGIINVLAAAAVLNVINAFALVWYVRRHYHFIDFNAEPDFQAIAKKNDVLVFQILKVVMTNVDVVLLTVFTNLRLVSVYSVYSMIVMQVLFLPNSIAHSISTSMGQLYYENFDKFKRIYDCFESYYLAINFTLFISLYLMIIPFITLYTSHITDINYVDPLLALLIIAIPLQEGLRIPTSSLIFWVGHFDRLKKYVIVEVIANLSLSLIFIRLYGMHGVLMATSLSMIYFTIISSTYAYKHIIHQSAVILVRKAIVLIILALGLVFAMRAINLQTLTFIDFFINGIITTVICGSVFFGGISLIERSSYSTLMEYIMLIVKRFQVRST